MVLSVRWYRAVLELTLVGAQEMSAQSKGLCRTVQCKQHGLTPRVIPWDMVAYRGIGAGRGQARGGAGRLIGISAWYFYQCRVYESAKIAGSPSKSANASNSIEVRRPHSFLPSFLPLGTAT